jgi:ribosomal protein S18 acetylase RimI-like enzyme
MRQAEDAGINASAPPQQLWLDGWLVRRSPGKAKRARCIQAVASGSRPLADKLAECERLFQAADLPLIVRITPFSRPRGLDASLAALGWGRLDDTRVMLLPDLESWVLRAASRPQVPPLALRAELADPERYAHAVGQLRGSTPAQISAHGQRLAYSPVPYVGMLWTDSLGQVAACGQFACQLDWVGLYDVFVAHAYRDRGLARSLCAGLLHAARGQGARHAYLQVEAGNAPARAVYRHLGFADAYAYHYRSPDPQAA